MTDLAKKKEEVKKRIRSLLLSAPLGLTLRELERDYNMIIGGKLPCRELGYTNTEQFLMDIPDTVQITRSTGQLVLTGVSDTSTQHIQRLVSQQKVDYRKNWGVLRNTPSLRYNNWDPCRGFNPRRGYSSIQMQDQREYMCSLPIRQHREPSHKPARHRNMPSVPAHVRGLIQELLRNYPDGFPLTHIGTIFQKHYGVPLDHSFLGFASVHDLFASLGDIVILKQLSVGETRVMSVEAALALQQVQNYPSQHQIYNKQEIRVDNKRTLGEAQQNEKPHMLPLMGTLSSEKPHILPLNENPHILPMKGSSVGETRVMSVEAALALQQVQNYPNQHQIYNKQEIRVDNKRTLAEAQQNEKPHIQPLKSMLSSEKPHILPLKEHNERVMVHEGNLPSENKAKVELYIPCNIPLTVQDNIREIMGKRPRGIYASRLPFEYKSTFKNDLPYKTYGYNGVIEFASDLPHIIKIERPHPEGDWHLLPANVRSSGNQSPEAKKQSFENEVVNIKVPKSVKDTIYQVLCMHPDGIPLQNFEDVYKKMTNQELDSGRFGASCLKQFLHSLSDILFISLNSSDKPIVCLKTSGEPRKFDKLIDQYQPTTVPDNQAVEPVVLPLDAVSPGCFYVSQPMPDFGDEAHYIDLYVSYVVNPSIFWIQLRGKETTLALEDLMDELEAIYSCKHLSPVYDMKMSLAKRGMICAVIFPEDGHWHRGIILDFKDQLFEVFYVDYGNVCSVSITQMRLLKTKLLKLPAQAIQARLSNIKPADGVWKMNSKNRLLTLCREKPLVGLVTNIQDGVLSLCLTDTTQDDDVHINDVFVEEGYAVFTPDTETVEIMGHSQAPSMELLYGENKATDNQDNVPVKPSCRRYIRQSQMTKDLVMNLINLDGHLYILSSEISNLFFEEDIISAQLAKDNTDVLKIVVTRKEQPELFSELALYGAPNFTETTNVISLFTFSALPLIIELYGEKGVLDEVKATALEIIDWFDPLDPYWMGEDDASLSPQGEDATKVDTNSTEDATKVDTKSTVDATKVDTKSTVDATKVDTKSTVDATKVDTKSTVDATKVDIKSTLDATKVDTNSTVDATKVDTNSTVDATKVDTNTTVDDSDMPSLFQLQQVLHSLECKKKRLLNQMMASNKCTSQNVDELNETELNMKRVSALVTKLQSVLCTPESDQSPASSVQVQVPSGSSQQELPRTSTQLQSTQINVPVMQTLSTKEETSAGSTGASVQSGLDVNAVLQLQLLRNKLLLEQLGISQQATSLQYPFGQLPLQSFGLGISIQQQLMQASLQLQNGISAATATQSLSAPALTLGGGNTQQLLQQLNSRMAACGLNSPLPNSLPTSQLADTGRSTQPAISGHQNRLGGLLNNIQGNICNWFSANGSAASESLPRNFNLQMFPPSVSSNDAAGSAGSASKSFISSSALPQSKSDLMSKLQMLQQDIIRTNTKP